MSKIKKKINIIHSCESFQIKKESLIIFLLFQFLLIRLSEYYYYGFYKTHIELL